MATYHCNSAGSNTAPYDTWAKAATTFTTAVGAAGANGDIIKVHKSHTEELAADTTYTFLANVSVIVVDKDAADALATMGTAAWVGNSTTNFSVSFVGAFKVYFYGFTARTAGATADSISFAGTDGAHFEIESCYLWNGNTATGSRINLSSIAGNSYVKAVNCTFRLGNVSQGLACGHVDIIGGSISSAGSVPSTIVKSASPPDGIFVTFNGVDLSHAGSATLMEDQTAKPARAWFSQCKLGASYVMLATQTLTNKSSGIVWVNDCSDGDVNILIGYADAFGTVRIDTGITFTGGAAGLSWWITTTANCSFQTPFVTPWWDYYNATLSAISPYLEIARDGSTTAYQDDEVWVEMMYKGTTGFPITTLATDRMTPLGTPANQAAGAGLGSWPGIATGWSGKLAPGSITPAEVGHIRVRVAVGEPSIEVYVDPQVRV